MRASRYLCTTLRENPKEAEIVSHRLMLRAGMIDQLASGIYSWLPLGLRVLQKIQQIIRQEHEKAGVLEMLAPTLQPCDLWKQSGRYQDYGQEMLRMEDRHKREMCFGPTAEEVFTHVFKNHIKSYRELPLCLYNIQWKFRDEIRPRFGVMRGREFLMKDAYSFDLTPQGARESYKKMFATYLRIFKRLGLKAIPLQADTGPIGGDLSHEFHIVAHTGESALFYDGQLDQNERLTLEEYQDIYAVADEKHDPKKCPVPLERLRQTKGIEIGHIFYFGSKYAAPMKAYIVNEKGEKVVPEMGSYGIGVSRLVGAIIEASHDDKGIKWPTTVAPFLTAIAHFPSGDESRKQKLRQSAEQLYQKLQEKQVEVYWYDQEKGSGATFSDMDLLGFPYQIILGREFIESGHLEIRQRHSGESCFLSPEDTLAFMAEQSENLSKIQPKP